MSAEEVRIYRLITVRAAEYLREIADGYSESDIAVRLGVGVNGVRSEVERLRTTTGCTGVRELGRWWREHRRQWLRHMGEAAGIEARPVEIERDPGA